MEDFAPAILGRFIIITGTPNRRAAINLPNAVPPAFLHQNLGPCLMKPICLRRWIVQLQVWGPAAQNSDDPSGGASRVPLCPKRGRWGQQRVEGAC